MMEWKPIPGFDGYEASDTGRVRNMNWRSPGRIRELTPCYDRDGYLMVCLSINGHQQNYRVHRLVAMAFMPVDGMENLQVNHKDERRDNNCLCNLEWATCIENNNYGNRNKRVSVSKTNGNSKQIEQYDLCGNLLAVFPSGHEVKRRLGFDNALIARCCLGKTPAAYGFVWKYRLNGGNDNDPSNNKRNGGADGNPA